MLWDLLALYERTKMYNKLPEDEEKTELDIWDFMGDKLLAVRKESMTAFLGKEELCSKMEHLLFGTDKQVIRFRLIIEFEKNDVQRVKD